MKLIMAVSKDGIVARTDDDKMNWTGHQDKKVFKLLTLTGGMPLGAGRKTFDVLPMLQGRSVVSISKDPEKGCTLASFDRMTEGRGWLIGGQTLALAAVDEGYVEEFFLCRSPNAAYSGTRIDLRLSNFGTVVGTVDFGGMIVEVRR